MIGGLRKPFFNRNSQFEGKKGVEHAWRGFRRQIRPPSSLHGRIFTQQLNSMARWLWLTTFDNLGAGFTASCQASYRTLNKTHSSRTLIITKSLIILNLRLVRKFISQGKRLQEQWRKITGRFGRKACFCGPNIFNNTTGISKLSSRNDAATLRLMIGESKRLL